MMWIVIRPARCPRRTPRARGAGAPRPRPPASPSERVFGLGSEIAWRTSFHSGRDLEFRRDQRAAGGRRPLPFLGRFQTLRSPGARCRPRCCSVRTCSRSCQRDELLQVVSNVPLPPAARSSRQRLDRRLPAMATVSSATASAASSCRRPRRSAREPDPDAGRSISWMRSVALLLQVGRATVQLLGPAAPASETSRSRPVGDHESQSNAGVHGRPPDGAGSDDDRARGGRAAPPGTRSARARLAGRRQRSDSIDSGPTRVRHRIRSAGNPWDRKRRSEAPGSRAGKAGQLLVYSARPARGIGTDLGEGSASGGALQGFDRGRGEVGVDLDRRGVLPDRRRDAAGAWSSAYRPIPRRYWRLPSPQPLADEDPVNGREETLRIGAIRDDLTGGRIDQEEGTAERDSPQIRRILRAEFVKLSKVLGRQGEIDVPGGGRIGRRVARPGGRNQCDEGQNRASQDTTRHARGRSSSSRAVERLGRPAGRRTRGSLRPARVRPVRALVVGVVRNDQIVARRRLRGDVFL